MWAVVAARLGDIARSLRNSAWLMTELSILGQNFVCFPPDTDKLESLSHVKSASTSHLPNSLSGIRKVIDDTIEQYLHSKSKPQPEFEVGLMNALIDIFREPQSPQCQALVFAVLQIKLKDHETTFRCMRAVSRVSAELSDALHGLLCSTFGSRRHPYVITTIQLLAQYDPGSLDASLRTILAHAIMTDEDAIFSHSIQTMSFDTWTRMMDDLAQIFRDFDFKSSGRPVLFFNVGTQEFALELSLHNDSFGLLEQAVGKQLAFRNMFICFQRDNHAARKFLTIADALFFTNPCQFQQFMIMILANFQSPQDVTKVHRTLAALMNCEPKMLQILFDLVSYKESPAKGLAKLKLILAFQTLLRRNEHQPALDQVAELFGIDFSVFLELNANILENANREARQRYQALVQKCRQIESVRYSIQLASPIKARYLFDRLGLVRSHVRDDMLALLPDAMLSCVDGINDDEIEMRWPITSLTRMQRTAIGLSNSSAFILRFRVADNGKPVTFGLQTSDQNNDFSARDFEQTSLSGIGVDPVATQKQISSGQLKPGTLSLWALLWGHLWGHFESLEQTYTLISNQLADWGRGCIMCRQGTVRLRRLSVCSSPKCRMAYLQAPVDVVLADVWQDQAALNLLLSSVSDMIQTGDQELATLAGFDASRVSLAIGLFASLPSVPDLAKYLSGLRNAFGDVFDLKSALRAYTADVDLMQTILTSTCLNYRGYLTVASQSQQIPGFGINQFLLVNATPELETAFANAVVDKTAEPIILFHGTSLDRLYSILRNGLRVQSGTSLQRHGAASGPGVYLADEPVTAWGYATASAGSWPASDCKNCSVVLGCELAGAKPHPGSPIQVVTDPNRLAVRYVFILPSNASMPAAANIRIPMASMYRNFRSNAW